MKIVSLALLFFVLMFVPSAGYSDVRYKIYPFESGFIEYEQSGLMEGTYTVYFEQWGLKQAQYFKSSMNTPGQSTDLNHLTLIDGEWEYSINLDLMTGMKIKNKPFETNVEKLENKDLHRRNITKWIERMNGRQVGTEEVLGKVCEIYEINFPKENARLIGWVWNNFMLKSKKEVDGQVVEEMTAVKFETEVKIPEDKFTAPEGVRFIDTFDSSQEILDRARDAIEQSKKTAE